MSSVYGDWWQRVSNPETIYKVLPKECIPKIDSKILP
jgi:hypothetical protein